MSPVLAKLLPYLGSKNPTGLSSSTSNSEAQFRGKKTCDLVLRELRGAGVVVGWGGEVVKRRGFELIGMFLAAVMNVLK